MPRLSGCDAGKPPIPKQRLRRRNVGFLRKCPDDVHRARENDAVACENQRPLGGVDQLEGALIFLGTRAPVGTELRFLRGSGVPIELARRLLRVFRDVDVHGTGTAPGRDLERFAEGRRDVVGARHQIVVLGNRQRDAGDVRFLERIGADKLAAHLAGDADDGRAVHHRRRDARHHVRRARSRRRNRDADPAARARIAVGHVRRALLVADEHVADRIIEHRVIRRKDGAARIPEDVGHTLANETFPNDLRSCAFHCCPHSFSPRGAPPPRAAVAYAPDLDAVAFLLSLRCRGAHRRAFAVLHLVRMGPHPRARAVAYAPDLDTISLLLGERYRLPATSYQLLPPTTNHLPPTS